MATEDERALNGELGPEAKELAEHLLLDQNGKRLAGELSLDAAQLMFYQRAFAVVVLTKTVESNDAWSVGLFDYKRRAFGLVNEQSMRDGMEPWTAVPSHRE